ncbi:hypothetical protein HS088_TW22G01476 [Tripterygium wilfordii]|uniref:Uncharacterized protein n=1 Tax=Tripterygium wilfordii TaxID=458696 RepID=A0A7J7C0U3_TRIWF|nr:uncharacterized protein LOC119991170 [Tripterygium wilfordii]KAF5727779.1 hypothetical protein HS088_TW22G01476 [Tripterygium wilfordii]
MKERGKAVEMYNSDMFSEYGSSSDLQCTKHPQSSSVGVCAYCLEDRLMKLVCSNCGEQRRSCCSCSSEVSSNRNSNAVEVGSVGRMSFLIENEQKDQPTPKPKSDIDNKTNEVFLLKRSSSSCVEIKRKRGFWRIGRLFGKKREKNCERSSVGGGTDEKSDLWVVDYMGVSRSRSLCSFRAGGFFGSEDGGDMMSFSGARSSISAARTSISAARRSGFSEGEPRKSGFSEAEPRRSGYDSERRDSTFMEHESSGLNGATRRIFSLREGNFTSVDGSGFIDLKFDFPSEGKTEFPALKQSVQLDPDSGFGSMREDVNGREGDFIRGGSCRITVSDRGIKKSRKSFKRWRWIFRQHPTARKKDEDFVVKPCENPQKW